MHKVYKNEKIISFDKSKNTWLWCKFDNYHIIFSVYLIFSLSLSLSFLKESLNIGSIWKLLNLNIHILQEKYFAFLMQIIIIIIIIYVLYMQIKILSFLIKYKKCVKFREFKWKIGASKLRKSTVQMKNCTVQIIETVHFDT